jgi:hypothetical protein
MYVLDLADNDQSFAAYARPPAKEKYSAQKVYSDTAKSSGSLDFSFMRLGNAMSERCPDTLHNPSRQIAGTTLFNSL